MRLAWFSPLPPLRSGIAACSAEVVAALRHEAEIDLFVDEAQARPAGDGRQSAHNFLWRHRQAPYDLTIYQLGNSSHHDFLWPYLFRAPGLAVLHDAHLHHARAASLLRDRRADDYRAEFAASAPDVTPDVAELAVAGFDSPLLYQWPLRRLILAASRATAVHNPILRAQLAAEHPGATVLRIRLGHGILLSPADAARRGASARLRYGIPADACLFGSFGGLTPDKRLPQILDAFAAVLSQLPAAWLLLAGAPADHYDVRAAVASHAAAARVTMTGYVESEAELTDCIAASDVTLNLRWPTAREMSGPWLRCLAAGRPSVVIDLAHTADLPTIDPRTWRPHGGTTAPPIAVAIDILDEDHSLRLAMRRLAYDRALRDAIGRAAAAYWTANHAPELMVDDYRRAIARAIREPAPAAVLPPHLRADPSEPLRRTLAAVGVPMPWSNI